MNTKRNQILNWQQQGYIDPTQIDAALEICKAQNSHRQWFEFISLSVLWLSVLASAFGVIFFFAYNWADLSTFTKFAVLQVLMLVGLFLYSQTETATAANKASLLFLALLIGALFALFGQTYQTGKDPWQLFFLWMIFVTPLAWVSKSMSLWLLWLFLANLTLNLILEVRFGFLGVLFNSARNLLLYAGLNLIAAMWFEYCYQKKNQWLKTRVMVQIAIVAVMIASCWIGLNALFSLDKHGLDLLIYLLWMSAAFYYYRVKILDVLIMSSWVISVIIIVLGITAKIVNKDLNGGTYLLFSILTIALSTAGVKWLLKLSDESGQGDEK